MYSLMLVDDEEDVRRAILETIRWEELGFQVVGEAENGREGLELAERLSPDVIITDIKMPFMDGIEMVRELRENNPSAKIVFLTGFNDFEYAQSAIQYNVMEYLLKPISAENLTRTLNSLREKLDKERDALRDIEKLRQSYQTDRLVMRMGFLHALVSGDLNRDYVQAAGRKLGLRLFGAHSLLFLTQPSKRSLEKNEVGIDDTDLMMISISNLVSQTADRYAENETFWHTDHIVTILSDEPGRLDRSEMLMREVQQNLQHFYGVSATIGVSARYEDPWAAKDAYESAYSALGYRLVLGADRIIHIDDIEPRESIRFLFDERSEAALHSIIKTGTKEQASAFIDGLFDDLRRRRATPSDYQIYVIEMFSTVVRTAKGLIPDFDLNVGSNLGFITEIFTHESIDDVKAWFERLCHRIIEYINLQRQDSADVLARQGYDYLREHYADSELSLKSVSAALHISPSYFSTLFKKAQGDSFTNVLIQIRMEHARELLLSTNKKIFEVAQETGYTDQHYFSYCFKKYYQQSPNELRRAAAGGNP